MTLEGTGWGIIFLGQVVPCKCGHKCSLRWDCLIYSLILPTICFLSGNLLNTKKTTCGDRGNAPGSDACSHECWALKPARGAGRNAYDTESLSVQKLEKRSLHGPDFYSVTHFLPLSFADLFFESGGPIYNLSVHTSNCHKIDTTWVDYCWRPPWMARSWLVTLERQKLQVLVSAATF